MGGSDYDWGSGIAVDSSGHAYVIGTTESTDFPTQNPYQDLNAGGRDAFIAKLSSSGSALSYSTYLGGNGLDEGTQIALDSSGNAYATGFTKSTNFPIQNAYQEKYGGGYSDVFITKLNSSGDTLSYSTYLGGSDYDWGSGIAVDSSGNTYVAGHTRSTDFPTQNPYQGNNAGNEDIFVTKLRDNTPPTTTTPDIKANGSDIPIMVSQSEKVIIDISLDPGDKAGQNADWWIAVSTPFASPANWYSFEHSAGWMPGINRYDQAPLFDISPLEVLNMPLPLGKYTFYFAIDEPDGTPTGPWWGLDWVEVTVTSDMPSTYTNSLGMTFILLPAGTFNMGSPSDEPGRNSNETQHQVTQTKPFYIQSTEVTQAQWEAVMGSNPSHFSGCPSCPVEWVSWYDVKRFIYHMNEIGEGYYRLPTEAEWEFSARAGSTTAFANGDSSTLDAIGWYGYNSMDKTHPVAQKAPNKWGIYDMHGNVYEWCQDWYGSYPVEPVTDPVGPESGSARIARGGSWYHSAEYCRAAQRRYCVPNYCDYFMGFRLVREP